MKCQIQLRFTWGTVTSVHGEESNSKRSGERAAAILFLMKCDHLVWLPPTKLFYQFVYRWLEGKVLVYLHFFSLAVDEI